MHETRRPAVTFGGHSGEERRCLKGLAGPQRIGKIKCIESTGHTNLLIRGLLDGDPPVSTPRERPKPNIAGPLGRIASVNSKPGIEIVTGVPFAALQYF